MRENFGYIGCENDVQEVLDRMCSGRRQCSVRVLDEEFPGIPTCHGDLKSFLEVDYTCERGMSDVTVIEQWKGREGGGEGKGGWKGRKREGEIGRGRGKYRQTETETCRETEIVCQGRDEREHSQELK